LWVNKNLTIVENKYWNIPDAFNIASKYNEEEIIVSEKDAILSKLKDAIF
jgi:hypothetical protein